MTEFLLVLMIYSGNGVAITTVKVPDKQSCIRAGEHHVKSERHTSIHRYECAEITKDK